MRKTRNYGDAGWITVLVIIVLFAYGWIANIITIFGMENITSGEGVIRIIGVFIAPLGAFMGYF